MSRLRDYSLDLISLIESGRVKTRQQLNEAKIELCKKHSVSSMPTNPTVLSFAKKRSKPLLKLLSAKPSKTLSGIAVVAVMTKPHNCPGSCIYCPSSLLKGRKTPKSYTGEEPATMRALSANFNPRKQVRNRLEQLQEAGHSTGKVELIVMGGTFLSQPVPFQRQFMLHCLNAFNARNSRNLDSAKMSCETAKTRLTGITFETRPDFCSKPEINRMLSFGGTRCELGVQTIYDSVYERIKRGHSVQDVITATALLKDSAFKLTYHYMPGLPGVSFSKDKSALKRIFSSPDFRPDSLKIYPCLVIEGTELYKQWRNGLFEPISTEKAAELVSSIKSFVPRWVRIMRVQRDIPSHLIAAGVKKSNLRQIALRKAGEAGVECNCIRCREAGLRSYKENVKSSLSNARLFTENYDSSNGLERFISFEDRKRKFLFGFLRLRQPYAPFRKEISKKTALVRELRVFGLPMPL
ncbi:MAG: tRNA uridine(34) 5-carboxymethylaminomethyl modification radical SAM/GNAT enzyme Elp3, partial [Candidatus Diapherotrites archaeon]|nr:tRNA uridine(34) 5-carboxymethylaminomethyl modification radical SAM/GNAT enzyme Elp3 [Candidatus Diapherotrites archaeon]